MPKAGWLGSTSKKSHVESVIPNSAADDRILAVCFGRIWPDAFHRWTVDLGYFRARAQALMPPNRSIVLLAGVDINVSDTLRTRIAYILTHCQCRPALV